MKVKKCRQGKGIRRIGRSPSLENVIFGVLIVGIILGIIAYCIFF